jgi:hypothetical protein
MSSLNGKVRDLPGGSGDLRLSELLRVSLLAAVGIEFTDSWVIQPDRPASASFPHRTMNQRISPDRRGMVTIVEASIRSTMKSLVKEVRTMAKAKKAKKVKSTKKSPKKGK